MSHLHFPDGILPIWLWVSAWAVIAALLAISLWYLSRNDIARKIPLIGVLSAMMILGMSIEIIALAYHINLAIPTAILLGPAGTIVSAFITNFFLALFGHGGMTVAGLNALLLAVEGLIGYCLFYYVIRITPLFWRGAIATFIALAISGMVSIGLMVWVAPQELAHYGEGDGAVRFELFAPHEEGDALDEHEEETAISHDDDEAVNVKRFVMLALGLGAVGWVLEALLSGFIISYIGRVKPDLIRISRS